MFPWPWTLKPLKCFSVSVNPSLKVLTGTYHIHASYTWAFRAGVSLCICWRVKHIRVNHRVWKGFRAEMFHGDVDPEILEIFSPNCGELPSFTACVRRAVHFNLMPFMFMNGDSSSHLIQFWLCTKKSAFLKQWIEAHIPPYACILPQLTQPYEFCVYVLFSI